MNPLILLRVSPGVEGGWLVHLGTPGVHPAFGRLTAAEVGALISEVRAQSRPPTIVIRGRMAPMHAAEAAIGRLLASVFGPAELAAAMALHRGALRGAGAVLVVDSADEAVAALPWELIAEAPDRPALEEAPGAIIARLGRGPAASAAAPVHQLRVLSWCPSPEDPDCAAALDALDAARRAAGLPGLTVASNLYDGLPTPLADTADWLHVICHGRVVEGGLVLDLGASSGAPGVVAAALAQGLPRLAGVLLAVCAGGAPSWRQLSDLAGRFLLAGAPAVVAPALPVSVEAVAAFGEGLISALGRGGSLGAAVRAGRRAVDALNIPHPDSRPSTFQLRVGALSVLEGAPILSPLWLPPGWPRLGPDLRPVMRRAVEAADRAGWLGLEHLLDAWGEGEGGALAQALRRALVGWDARFQSELRLNLAPRKTRTADLCATPRMRRLGYALPDGAGLDELAAALIADPHHGLHALSPQPLSEVRGWDASPSGGWVSQLSQQIAGEPGEPATGFEVVWGPEDGRRLWPSPGSAIGRWSPEGGADIALYVDTPTGDQRLHRRQILSHGPGEATLLHSGRILPAGGCWPQTLDRRGRLAISVGDLILLTHSTWLRGIADAPGMQYGSRSPEDG